MSDRERWAREHWESGLTYDAWKRSMTRNLDRVEANDRRVKIEDHTRRAFEQVERRLRVVAVGADWCGDVIANLPVLARLAKETGELDVRVFERDGAASPIDFYLNQGAFKSIPVFAFFDADWKEVGVFIERPESVTETRARKRHEIFAAHPEFGSPDAPPDQLPEDVRARLQQEVQKMRDGMADWADGEVIREIGAIALGQAKRGGARQPDQGERNTAAGT
ncbi:MAG: thioredoxin family protein [Candidatus Limnocylindria bacterium]